MHSLETWQDVETPVLNLACPNHSVERCGGLEALASTTMLKKCGV